MIVGTSATRGKQQWEPNIRCQNKFLEHMRYFGDTQHHVGEISVEQRFLLEHMEAGPMK